MRKILLMIAVVLCAVAGGYWFCRVRLDYHKVVFVLPSSKRVASDYYYKKDGDFFLAEDLRAGLEKLGYKVAYRFREDYENLNFGNAGNVIYFKGYYVFKHLPEVNADGRKRVLYLYYMEGVYPEIFNEVDAVVVGSKGMLTGFAPYLGGKGVYVPQFTNPERFKPAPKEADKSYEVLFVGSDHTREGRKSVDYALKAGANLAVFGKFWEKTLPLTVLKGKYIDNDELYKYYAGAEVVLNDHREDMLALGAVSNRIYDVTASGGFIFTDYMPEIEEAYGETVATYKNYAEFKEKLAYYLAHPEERAKMAEAARQITLRNFTNLKAAEKFDAVLKNIKK